MPGLVVLLRDAPSVLQVCTSWADKSAPRRYPKGAWRERRACDRSTRDRKERPMIPSDRPVTLRSASGLFRMITGGVGGAGPSGLLVRVDGSGDLLHRG